MSDFACEVGRFAADVTGCELMRTWQDSDVQRYEFRRGEDVLRFGVVEVFRYVVVEGLYWGIIELTGDTFGREPAPLLRKQLAWEAVRDLNVECANAIASRLESHYLSKHDDTVVDADSHTVTITMLVKALDMPVYLSGNGWDRPCAYGEALEVLGAEIDKVLLDAARIIEARNAD
jgi:hypothetical protein